MARLYATTCLLLFLPFLTIGQISFSNANDRLSNSSFHSGVAIAVLDMNGDGLDDIVRLSQGRELQIEYQQLGNAQFLNYTFGQVSNQSQWSMCAADVNNDGFNDVVTGGRYDGVKLVRAMEGGGAYEMSTLPGNTMFVQGSNLVDINNDGYVDYFACHDDGESRIWANDSTGHFVPADDWLDMATVPASDNSGNYGSIWTDFDNDGDIDLYIAKCRQGVNNPSDPRRINALFVNDGAGHFTEMADTFNLKIGAQSWTADFQDIDNDGDYDCFITNHDVPSMLLENDGTGHFTDITSTSGISIVGLPLQGVMRDFDNDGFVDIIVAGTRHYLFHNNGDKTFTEVPGLFDNNWMESYAIGDLNHDGFLDIYGGYSQVYTTPSNIDDVLWLNDAGSGNNFFAVTLIGEQSNRNGIGARIEIYGDWGIQVREVRAGESYGIMNSMTQYFGLGQSSLVDSLIVRWPSGVVDHYDSLAVNQFVSLVEDACTSPTAVISQEGPGTICSGDTVYLYAPEGFLYQWSNGDTTQSIAVTEQGVYNVTISDGSPCFGVSPGVEIIVNPDETPTITVEGETQFCAGGSVTLIASEAADYSWSNGAATLFIEVTESGEYTVTTPGMCEDFTSAPVTVTVLPSSAPEIESVDYVDTLAQISLTGSNVFWYDSPAATMPFATGNQLSTPINSDTTFYAENIELYPGAQFATGQLAHQGGEYSGNQFNGDIVFDCFSPFTLHTVKVYTDTEGSRIIELQDAGGNVLQSKQVDIPVGENVISLEFEVEPGTGLILTTNTANNQAQFGYVSPRLQRSDAGIEYPYVVEGVVSLNTATLGSNRYYYFYDWRIQEPSFECVSERIGVSVEVVGTNEATAAGSSLRIAPNPTSGWVEVQLPTLQQTEVRLLLLDAIGRVVAEQSIERGQRSYSLDLSGQPAGLYHLQLVDGKQVFVGKVVKW
ncbi:MAG: VCBS repeat-containing protein [Phaeodactylibacter sp.]|nr:VCBS repeat-containing protein [Phaeodactylibacter sp.]MCB9302477.1 VCBS repeat-containing protein [Lewinellaceae bacterium]